MTAAIVESHIRPSTRPAPVTPVLLHYTRHFSPPPLHSSRQCLPVEVFSVWVAITFTWLPSLPRGCHQYHGDDRTISWLPSLSRDTRGNRHYHGGVITTKTLPSLTQVPLQPQRGHHVLLRATYPSPHYQTVTTVNQPSECR